MRMLIPLGHERHQPLLKVGQVGEIGDAQALALQDAEPLLSEPILLHFL
jgi:hypothetical protein